MTDIMYLCLPYVYLFMSFLRAFYNMNYGFQVWDGKFKAAWKEYFSFHYKKVVFFEEV